VIDDNEVNWMNEVEVVDISRPGRLLCENNLYSKNNCYNFCYFFFNIDATSNLILMQNQIYIAHKLYM